jgi:hypothetical protein
VLLFALVGCGGDKEEAPDAAVDQFEKAGGDTSEPRPISYFLVLPSDDAARRAADDLSRHGFAVDAEYTAEFAEEGEGWLVVEKVGTVADLAETEALLGDVAARHGGQYDGWEAAP